MVSVSYKMMLYTKFAMSEVEYNCKTPEEVQVSGVNKISVIKG